MNKNFYKKAGFIFIGIIVVLIVARYTVLTPKMVSSHREKRDGARRTIDWQDTDQFIGKYATVRGRIVRTHNSGRACFLNFHPGRGQHFYAVIFNSDFDKFPSHPESYYRGKEVEVAGSIREYEGSPQIILNSPSQIRIIE